MHKMGETARLQEQCIRNVDVSLQLLVVLLLRVLGDTAAIATVFATAATNCITPAAEDDTATAATSYYVPTRSCFLLPTCKLLRFRCCFDVWYCIDWITTICCGVIPTECLALTTCLLLGICCLPLADVAGEPQFVWAPRRLEEDEEASPPDDIVPSVVWTSRRPRAGCVAGCILVSQSAVGGCYGCSSRIRRFNSSSLWH